MLESEFSGFVRAALTKTGCAVDKIETGETARGVPDLHIQSPRQGSYWIELKICRTKKLTFSISSPQVIWAERHAGLRGVSWIVVYCEGPGNIALYPGADARAAKDLTVAPVWFPNLKTLIEELEYA